MFLYTLGEVISQWDSDEYLFLGGDFNCTEDSRLDRNHLEPHPASLRRLARLTASCELRDVWRSVHGIQKQFTWAHSKDNVLSLARLDRFYCFKHHLNIFRSSCIIPVGFTDHCMVHCSVLINKVKTKSAFWHFNTTLLADRNFVEVFKKIWTEYRKCKGDYTSLQQWWDVGKCRIRQLCQQHTLNVRRDRARSMRELEIEVVDLPSLAESTGDRGHIEALTVKKTALSSLLGVKAQGALVWSRFMDAMQWTPHHIIYSALSAKMVRGRSSVLCALTPEQLCLILMEYACMQQVSIRSC